MIDELLQFVVFGCVIMVYDGERLRVIPLNSDYCTMLKNCWLTVLVIIYDEINHQLTVSLIII